MFSDDLIKNIIAEEEKKLFSALGVEKNLIGGNNANTLTVEDIMKTAEELEKFKTEIKPSLWVEFDKVYVIDHEKIRESIPCHKERGTTILYNPKNKKLEKELRDNGYIR